MKLLTKLLAPAEPQISGGGAAAVAPPTPAATPNAPPTPPPVPTDDDFAALDATFKKADVPPPTTKGKEPPKPEPKKDAPATPPVKGEPLALRKEYEKLKADYAAKEQSETSLKAKIAEFEARGKDTTVLTEQLAAVQKRMDDISAENRALKQEVDPAFKKQWDRPFELEAELAERDMEGVSIYREVKDPDTGAVSHEVVRPATYKDDFVRLYRMPRAVALQEADKLFGNSSEIVKDHLKTLWRLDYQRNAALTEQKEQWKAKATEEAATRVQQQEQVKAITQRVRKELGDKVDDYHDPADDKELNEARDKGYSIFDAEPKSFQQYVLKQEHIRHRVAAFGPMKLKILRLETKLAEAQAELTEAKPKPPGATKHPGGSPPAIDSNESFEDGLRKHMANVS